MSLAIASESDNRIVQAMDELRKQLTDEEFEMLMVLLKTNRGKELDVLVELMGYTYEEKPVSMREFIESPDYLNMAGQVYPVLIDDLEEMFSGKYDEAVLTGGIGWGKSTVSELALVRMVYEVLCLKDPQKVFDLARGTVIAFVNVSITKEQAKEVVFEGIRTKIKNSPFFTHRFPYDKDVREEMRFPKQVWIAPVVNPMGYNVFGGVIDEINFMAMIEKSRMARGGIYDRAQIVHDNLMRRMKSRFMRRGKIPGILLSISSAKYPDDFTEKMIAHAQEDSRIFWRRYSQWGTKPKHFFIGEKFYVSLGDSSKNPEILTDDGEGIAEPLRRTPMQKKTLLEKEGIPVIEVPVEYKKDFERDLDGAIRDLAGMPSAALHPFIINRSKIFDAIDRGTKAGLLHPYSVLESTLQDGATFLNTYLHPDSKPRYVHIDLALTQDAAGFAMGHTKGWKSEWRRDDEGNEYQVFVPEIVIDIMLRIKPPASGEIQIADVRSLVYELRNMGFRIAKVTFDQFQSAESRQQLRRKGIEAEHLSADGNPEVYQALKEALYEDRLWVYDYEPFLTELIRLERNERTGKVDHPSGGSKDVSDAVAGVCYHCTTEKPMAVIPPSYGMMDEGARNPYILQIDNSFETEERPKRIDPLFGDMEDDWIW